MKSYKTLSLGATLLIGTALPVFAVTPQEIANEMIAEGYVEIEISRTILGRTRIEGSAPFGEREVVLSRDGTIVNEEVESFPELTPEQIAAIEAEIGETLTQEQIDAIREELGEDGLDDADEDDIEDILEEIEDEDDDENEDEDDYDNDEGDGEDDQGEDDDADNDSGDDESDDGDDDGDDNDDD